MSTVNRQRWLTVIGTVVVMGAVIYLNSKPWNQPDDGYWLALAHNLGQAYLYLAAFVCTGAYISQLAQKWIGDGE